MSVWLRREEVLIIEMKKRCPKKTQRWVQLGKLLEFYITNRVEIMAHCERKQSLQAPTCAWWVRTLAIYPAIELVNCTIVTIQRRSLLLTQQRAEVATMISKLTTMFGLLPIPSSTEQSYGSARGVEGELQAPVQENIFGSRNLLCDSSEVSSLNSPPAFSFPGQFDQRFEPLLVPSSSVDPTICFEDGTWFVTTENIVKHIEDQGSAAKAFMLQLQLQQRCNVLHDIAQFAVRLVSGLERVQAERDQDNKPADTSPTPVTPAELVSMRTGDFIRNVIDKFRTHLKMSWSDKDIEKIEHDHINLLKAYRDDPAISAVINRHDHKTSFNTGWNDLVGRFPHLRGFCGGLACVFANTTSVESDFSILKWEKNDFRTGLTNLSLEGIFQTKQYEYLGHITDE